MIKRLKDRTPEFRYGPRCRRAAPGRVAPGPAESAERRVPERGRDTMAVRRAVRGAVRVLTIDRPEASNALDPDTSAALSDELRAAERDDTVAAVVLTGSGQRAFCAGMDLKAFAA